jgi:hypothetical protein
MGSTRSPRTLITLATAVALAVLAVGGCSSSGSSSGSTGAAAPVDVQTATCADIRALPSENQINGADESLRAMASNEGLTVTADMQNSFIVRLNDTCDSDGTELWTTAATSAYVAVTSGQ